MICHLRHPIDKYNSLKLEIYSGIASTHADNSAYMSMHNYARYTVTKTKKQISDQVSFTAYWGEQGAVESYGKYNLLTKPLIIINKTPFVNNETLASRSIYSTWFTPISTLDE